LPLSLAIDRDNFRRGDAPPAPQQEVSQCGPNFGRAQNWAVTPASQSRTSQPREHIYCAADVEALEDTLVRHGNPEICNTDQGSQFTGAAFTGVLIKNGIAISMDGKGAWRDNVFVERPWRTVKYEEVHLKATALEARASIGRHFGFHNLRRPQFEP
jgi:putative transposase